MKIEFRSEFHGSSVELNVSGSELTRGQMKKLRHSLCGVSGCVCALRDVVAFGAGLKRPTVVLALDAAKDGQGYFQTITVEPIE